MKTAVLFSVSLILSISVVAQGAFLRMSDPAVFRELADNIARTTQTIQCAFVQKKQLSFMEHPVESKGRFYFSSDNHLRWEYVSPFSYIILMNGDQLTIIDEGMRSDMAMSENPAFKKVQKLLSTVLRGDLFAAQSDFDMDFQESPDQYRIILTPRHQEMKQYVSGMELYFEKADMMLSAFVMHEQGGDLTNTQFTERSVNKSLPAGIFTPTQ